MDQNNKTNEQLHEEFEHALQNLSDKLYALLHYGNYALKYLDRDYETRAVRSAHMEVGEHYLVLQAGSYLDESPSKGTKVTITLPDNPVNEQLLASWDAQTLDRDIDYYQRYLNDLLKRKEELSKQNKE